MYQSLRIPEVNHIVINMKEIIIIIIIIIIVIVIVKKWFCFVAAILVK